MDIGHPTVPRLDYLSPQRPQLQRQPSLQKETSDALFSFSPDSLYSYSVDEYNAFATASSALYATDYSADSPLSLGSPVSPTNLSSSIASSDVNVSTNSAVALCDFNDPWTIESEDCAVKPEPDTPPFDIRTVSVSPAIDPLRLAASEDACSYDFALPVLETDTMPSPRDRRYAVRKSSGARKPEALFSASKPSSTSGPTSGSGPGPVSLKRKSSSDSSGLPSPPAQSAGASGTYQPPKKTAHNLIEKRYRTNLNDKILALRDSVPSLRVVVRRSDAGLEEDEEDCRMGMAMADDLGGLTPAHKLNKATILGKATEYIAHLERRNELLARENESLRSKVDGYEMFVMGRNEQSNVWN